MRDGGEKGEREVNGRERRVNVTNEKVKVPRELSRPVRLANCDAVTAGNS